MKDLAALRSEGLSTPSSSEACFWSSCWSVVATPSMWLRGSWSSEPPWCLESTVMAALRAEMDSRRSFSSALNSASCFWRRAVALSRDSWFAATSLSRFLISVFSRALPAVSSSTLVVRSPILVSASAMALVFSLSFVEHQQASLSYTSSSSSASFCSCFDMSFSRVMTLETGRFFAAEASRASAEAAPVLASRPDAITVRVARHTK
mmetsp:Transcript_97920/g.285702  ORF Transcript_97920/g.285702 Transcript_97920/m.285702 type:complete len:207 (+) Transcript_97920:695-1315(+)